MPEAWACTCGAMVPEWAFEDSDAVYVGRVVRAGGLRGCASADVAVTEALVGVEVGQIVRRPVYMGTGGGDCSFGEMPFEEGDRWLWFGDEDDRISMCSPDTPMALVTDEDMETLRRLAAGVE